MGAEAVKALLAMEQGTGPRPEASRPNLPVAKAREIPLSFLLFGISSSMRQWINPIATPPAVMGFGTRFQAHLSISFKV